MGKPFWRSVEYFFTGNYSADDGNNSIVAIGFGGEIHAYGGDDHVTVGSIGATVYTGSGNDTVVGGSAYLRVEDTTGHLSVKGAAGYADINKSGDGNVSFAGAAGGVSIDHLGNHGDVNYGGAAAYNGITRKGLSGNVTFKGAGGYNALWHETNQGNLSFAGAGAGNKLDRTWFNRYQDSRGDVTFDGAGAANSISSRVETGNITFRGAGADNHLVRKGKVGDVTLQGAGASNRIERTRQAEDVYAQTRGNIRFEGVGGYNSLYSDVAHGDIHFSGGGAYNTITRKGSGSSFDAQGMEYAKAEEIVLTAAQMHGLSIDNGNKLHAVTAVKSEREPNTYLFAIADGTYTKINKVRLYNDPETGKLKYYSEAWFKRGNHLTDLARSDVSSAGGFEVNPINGGYTLANIAVEHQQSVTVHAVEKNLTEYEWVTYANGALIDAKEVSLSEAKMGGDAIYADGTKVDVQAVKSNRKPNTYIYAKLLGRHTKIVVVELANDPKTGALKYQARSWYKEGDHTADLANEDISSANGYHSMGKGGYSLSDLHYSVNAVRSTSETVADIDEYTDQTLFKPATDSGESSGDVHFNGAGGGNVIKSNVTRGNVYFNGGGIANVILHSSQFGHTEFNGSGAANVIVKSGEEGDLTFRGAGLANVLVHQSKQGKMDVYAGGAVNVLVRIGDGQYLAHLLAYGNISVHKGNGNSRVVMLGGYNTHTQIGSGNGLWLAAGGFNVMTQVGKGDVASVLAGGANVLTKVGDGDLTAGMLGGANVITHISGDNETSNTTAVALGGANILTKKGKGNALAVMGGGANVLTHVGDGTTTGVMVGGANILTKVGNGDTTGIMLGVGNVLTHVGDGQTLGVMGAAGNIFTKVGDGTSIAVMIGAGNIFTHVGEGNAWALMGGLGNVFTKVGNGDALALMVAEANVFTHIGDGMSVALMLAKGNVATKVGNGTTLAAMVGNANIFTHVGSGSTFAAMIGQANIMTKVGDDLTAALMVGKANIYTHVGDGTSLGIFAGEVNVMTKVGNGTTLAAMFGKANIMTHVGDGLTGVLALGEANIVTKVGDDFMGVVAAAKANVVTHVGDATTAAVLAGKGNILTKVGEGTTVGLLISDIGNVMTHVGDGTTIGIAKGKANIITKVGDGLGVNVAWGQANVFTQVGDGDRYNFAKGEANVITKVGDGQEVSVVQGKANIITHVGNGDDYTGAWGKANVITKVGNGRNVVLAKGEANIVTQVGDGDSFNALWSKGNIVTKVGDGMQVTAAKGKANITTTVGDGLSVTAAYGDANINTKVGDGVSVNVAWGKYNINTKVGDGLNVAVMKGKANANIHIGDGLGINASYAQNNVAIKIGNGDFYSLAVASSNTSSNKLSALFDNIKQTVLGVGGSQAINYLVQGDEASSSGTQKGRGAIATPEITKLDGFQMDAIEEVGSDLGDSLTGSVTKVDTPDLNKMQNALDVDGSSDQTQAPNLIVNGDFEQGDQGWKSTHGVEASHSGNVYGVNGEGHGARVTELDTYTNTSLYQDLTDLTEGEVIAVSFDFAKRAGLSNNEGIEVLWNGEVVFSSSGDASAWQQKTLKLTAHAGSNRIEFKGTGQNDGLGYILDNVVAKSESSQQANAVSEHATQNQASQNALSDKERAEADRQRLEQEKQKQLDAVAGSQSQLESTDQKALENNGQAQRDAVKEESEAVTAELTKLAQGLDVLDGQATHTGESGDQWRNDFAGGLLDGVQRQLDDAKQLANDKIAAAKQTQSDNNSKVKESVAKSEAGVAKGEQNRAGAEQDIADAKADAETRKADAVAKSNDAKQAESDAHSAANDAQSRGDRDAMNAENKANQAQNDAKGTKQNEGDRPDREGVTGSGLSGNAHRVEGAGETGSHVTNDSQTNADGRFSEGLSEQEQEALEGATNAVNRLQINAGIRGKNSGSTISSMFTETNSDSIVVPTAASQDVVRKEIRISGVNLEGLGEASHDGTLVGTAVNTMLRESLPFYSLRTERNLLVQEGDEGFEVRAWAGTDGKSKTIILKDPEDPAQHKAIERFILANFDNFEQMPDELFLVDNKVISHHEGRTHVLAQKVDGAWQYNAKVELMSVTELLDAANVTGKIRGESYQQVIDALTDYHASITEHADYEPESVEKLLNLRKKIEGYVLGHPDSGRVEAMNSLLNQVNTRLDEVSLLSVAEQTIQAQDSFSRLYDQLEAANLKESKHLYLDQNGDFVTKGKGNLANIELLGSREAVLEKVKLTVSNEYGQTVADTIFAGLSAKDLAKDGKGVDIAGLNKVHQAIEQHLSPVSATLYIWKPSDHSALGHAALQIGQGRMQLEGQAAADFNKQNYVSWWPLGSKSSNLFNVATKDQPDLKLRWKDFSQPAAHGESLAFDMQSEENDDFGLKNAEDKLKDFIKQLASASGVDEKFKDISQAFTMMALMNPDILESANIPEHISKPFVDQWNDTSYDMQDVAQRFAKELQEQAKVAVNSEQMEQQISEVVQRFAQDELDKIQAFKETQADQGRVFRINLEGLDVAAMQAEWNRLSNDPDARYQLLTKNCSSTVAKVLKAGGADKLIGHTWRPKFGVWTPTELFNFGQALQEAQLEIAAKKQSHQVADLLDALSGNEKHKENVAIENDGTPPRDKESLSPLTRFLNNELYGEKDARRKIGDITQTLLDHAVENGESQKVTLKGEAGRLTGYYHQGAASSEGETSATSGKVVLFLHGSASSAEEQASAIRNHYQKQGIDMLAVNLRGYGESDGGPSEKGLYQDARTMFNYLVNDKGIDPSNIIIHGYSMGGPIAADLARYAAQNGQAVSGLLLDRPMPSMTKAITAHEVANPAGIVGAIAKAVNGQFSVEKNLKGLPKETPILLLTDNEGLGEEGEKLRAKLAIAGYNVTGEQTFYGHEASNRLMGQYADQIVSGLFNAEQAAVEVKDIRATEDLSVVKTVASDTELGTNTDAPHKNYQSRDLVLEPIVQPETIELGMPDIDQKILAEVAERENVIIGVRPVDEKSKSLIDSKLYSSKGLFVKAKSSDWGPMSGFIPVDQAFAKASARRDLDKFNGYAEQSIESGNAVSADLYLNQFRIDELVSKYQSLTALEFDAESGMYKTTATNGDQTVTFFLNKVTVDSKDLWQVHYIKDGKLAPFKVIGDPVSKQPMTADYDLLTVMYSYSDLGPQDKLKQPLTWEQWKESVTYEELTPKYKELYNSEVLYNKKDGASLGVVSERLKALKDVINTSLGRTDGLEMVHHGADDANPYAVMADNFPATFFVPKSFFMEDGLGEGKGSIQTYFNVNEQGAVVIRDPQEFSNFQQVAINVSYRASLNDKWNVGLDDPLFTPKRKLSHDFLNAKEEVVKKLSGEVKDLDQQGLDTTSTKDQSTSDKNDHLQVVDSKEALADGKILHNRNVNDWERVVVTPTADGGETRFDGQIIVQMENDAVAAKAAANLAGKHPESSVVVQLDSDGNYRVVYGDPSKLDGKLRWQLVGHGRDDSESNNTRLSGYSADELAMKLAKFQQSFNQAENVSSKPDHISIVGCSLVSDDKQKGFGHQFINAMDANGLRLDVSVRSSELAVDETGRKHTKDANGNWVQKAESNKVSLSWNEQGDVVAKDERIRNGIAEGDIDLSRIGISDVDEPARGAIGDNKDVFDAPEKRKAETETSSSSANNKLSYSGNIQVNVGDGEFTAVNWGTSNVGIKVGTGGFKSLAFGDNNVMIHIGNGESKHSFDIGGYQALEGAQMFIGNRNVSFNKGRSNDLIVMMDKSIPTPPLVNPFDGAARISGVLQSIATSGEGKDWLAAQEQQWTLSGAKKFVKDMSGLDQSSSVDYTSLVELDSQNERSSRGLKHDAEAALNKQYNQWLSGNGNNDTSKLSRADKLRQANEKLAFNFAVGGQGADIQVTTGNWNFMFGDNIQSILDTNLGSLFGLMTQQFSATGQAKTTFTYTPEDLPRQLKNKLLGQLAGVGAETTLADIFGVDYTASGHIVSRNGEAVDGVAILKEMLEVIGEFSGDQLQAFVDPTKLLNSLEAGIDMGADGIKSFAETHGLKEKAPEEEESKPSVSFNGETLNSTQGATVADGSTETTEKPDRAFGFNSLNLPNLFATIFSQDKQKEMKSLVANLKENLTADLLNMKEKTFDFLRNSGHLQGDGDINLSLGNYNFNWGGDGKDLGAYLGDNNNFWGGRGDDVFYATGTSNIFTGGEGNDMGVLMGRENMMFGGDGNDTAVVAGRINHVFLGAGDDQSFVFGEGGEIDTGSGRDYVVTSGNFNRVDTGDDQDYSVTIGNNNQVELGAGDDFANVFGNYNRINASAGNDVVKLMGYHAVLNGGEGEDHLIAAAISKFSQFNGGEGRDLMVLGGYQNTFKGGTDVDSFVVSGDVIDNLVEDIRSEDNIVFNGIDWQKLWFERSGYDLKLSILRDPASDSDQAKFEHIGSVTFSDYFNGNRAQVIIAMGEKDATGEREYTTLSESAIDALVQAMSGFDPQAGDNGFIDNLDSKSRVAITTAWADVVHKKGITV
ncbi:MARTX multifunctional-autoprocessing repeats-in-toxin holotoxin RtxA [Vibrio vulnificus]